MSKEWIGVDLDGTLAYYEPGGGYSEADIGPAISPMIRRVKRWLREGRTVKIMTARVSHGRTDKYVRKWLDQHGLNACQITNEKDAGMLELWDDRAVAVERNTGRRLSPSTRGLD